MKFTLKRKKRKGKKEKEVEGRRLIRKIRPKL